MELKICMDCRYYGWGTGAPEDCLHEKSKSNINPVNGYVHYKTCEFMREGYSESGGSSCGKEAVLFEQKKPWWKIWT